MIKLALNSYILKNEPLSLIHFVTNRCNARCKHCFIDFENPSPELSLSQIKRLSKSFGNSIFNINLTGGEPFIREDLFDIAEAYIENTTIQSLFISTNGFFTERIRSFIDRFNSLKSNTKLIFSISIDNFEEKHDLNRNVKGLFKNAIKTYRLIKSYNNPNIMSNIGITITDSNYKDVIKLYHFLRKEKIDSFTVTIMRKEGIIKEIFLTEEMLEVYKDLSEIIEKDRQKGDLEGYGKHLQGRLMNSKNSLINKIISKTYINKKFIAYCSAGSLFGVIYANGDVYPCEMLNKKLGNLEEYGMDFLKLWNNDASKEFRKWVKKTKCNCSFECAWSVNIISSFRFLPQLLKGAL